MEALETRPRKIGIAGVLVLAMLTPSLYFSVPSQAYSQASQATPIAWPVDVVFETYPADLVAWSAQRNATLLYDIPSHKIAGFKANDYVSFLATVLADSDVEEAAASVALSPLYAPNDPCYAITPGVPNPACPLAPDGGQWNLRQISMPTAWNVTLGSNITTAIIDTGVTFTHPDLFANVQPNLNESWANNYTVPYFNGIDDDNNGCRDDHYGCAFSYNKVGDVLDGYSHLGVSLPGLGIPLDDVPPGHGTHAAGIAHAVINNSIGIAGISNSKYIPVKVGLNSHLGLHPGDVNQGVAYASRRDADILSMSIGGPLADAPASELLDAMWNEGRLLVAASGNQEIDYEGSGFANGCTAFYPARHPRVISVSATNSLDLIAPYSCIGKVDLSAPGGDSLVDPLTQVYSTATPTGWAQLSGTSMAAPHVSGVASLIWSHRPSLTNAQVRDILFNTADDNGQEGKDRLYGHGRLNASRALAVSGSTSAPVASFIITPTSGTTQTLFQVNASQSFDLDPNDLSSLNYTWNWNDGNTSYGSTSNHTWTTINPNPGHLVRLTVRDAGGNSATITDRVSVSGSVSQTPCTPTSAAPFALTSTGAQTTSGTPAPVAYTGQTRQVTLNAEPASCGLDLRFKLEVWSTSTSCLGLCTLEQTGYSTWTSAASPTQATLQHNFTTPGEKRLRAFAETRPTGGGQSNSSAPEDAPLLVIPYIENVQDRGFAMGLSLLEQHGIPDLTASNVELNDTLVGRQWATAYLGTKEAWIYEDGNPSVVVAIVDSGVNLSHPDLQGRLWTSGQWKGADFSAGPNNPGTNPEDELGHGTHLAGIIAANAANSLGVAGMTKDVKVMPIKVGTANSSADRVAAGIRWAADHNAHIILVGVSSESPVGDVASAIDYARSQGSLVISSSGNGGWNGTGRYPAGYNSTFAVVGIDHASRNASYSQQGSWADIAAPATGIVSTWAPAANASSGTTGFTFDGGKALDQWGLDDGPFNASLTDNLGQYYGNVSGTSAAAAFVAAVAAFVKSSNMSLSATDLEQVLQGSARDMGGPGKDSIFGYGIVDADRAVRWSHAIPTPGASISPSVGWVSTTFFAGASESIDPLRGTLNYTWTWGDSSPLEYGVSASHQYSASGTYTVRLDLRNALGLKATTTRQVVVL